MVCLMNNEQYTTTGVKQEESIKTMNSKQLYFHIIIFTHKNIHTSVIKLNTGLLWKLMWW